MTISECVQELGVESGTARAISGARTTKAVRILHVLGGMDRGGVETWLMHVLRNIDRQQFQMDFAVHTDRRCAYDDEVEALGSRIYFCPSPSNPVRYARSFLKILREHGPYDVVHSHVHHFSGFVLRLAKSAGVSVRIAHSHSTSPVDSPASFSRRCYLQLSRHMIRECATWRLAASGTAGSSLFGLSWSAESGTLVSHCGLDLEPFTTPVDRLACRYEIGVKPEDFVVGHVGRLVQVKNQEFLLRVYAELLKIKPNTRLLLVGEGPLERLLKHKASELGVLDRVLFTGGRSDVARLMLGAMDAFVMPSIYEGLGLAAIEAQAAGLPTVLSDRMPPESDTRCGLVRFVSIGRSEAHWANEIVQHTRRRHIPQRQALTHVKATQFNIQRNLEALSRMYSNSAVTGTVN